MIYMNRKAISPEIRPIAALYPPPHIFFNTIESGANAVGMCIPTPETTESWDREQSTFSMGGGGYNASRGFNFTGNCQ